VTGRSYSREQARAYLDVNCSYCHNDSVKAKNQGWFAEFDRPFSGMKVCNPGQGTIEDNPIVVPHSPHVPFNNESLLMARMESLIPGAGQMMPPRAKTVADDAGLSLIGRWISELASNCAAPPVALKSVGSSAGDQSADACLTLPNPAASGPVSVTACNPGVAGQSFSIVDDGGGYVSLLSSSGKCVQETANVGEVLSGTCTPGAWRRVSVPGGSFELRSKNLANVTLGDDLRCLEADTNGLRAVACSARPAQLWTTLAR